MIQGAEALPDAVPEALNNVSRELVQDEAGDITDPILQRVGVELDRLFL
jgi:hypothetical protein